MYSYSKDPVTQIENPDLIEISINNLGKKKKTTIWSIFGGTYSSLKTTSQKTKLAKILIPGLFIFAGIIFIYQEFYPDVQQMIQNNSGYYTQSILSPVDEQYINISQYIAKPDFTKLTQSALGLNILKPDPTSLNFNGTFYISIPSLGINKLPVKSNVDSTTESSYMSVLDYALAHFKNTGLPISDIGNNMVVYGHSASPNYNPSKNDPMLAFSFIPELKIGDEIIIEINNQTFKYKMFRSKIVNPDDTSIITGTQGKGTLTLFTCFPLGSNAQRYVAVARPV